MEVKNCNAAYLCNYEVLTYLNELKSKAQTPQEKNSHLATILYETSHFLTDSLNSSRIRSIPDFLTELLSFPVPLTKPEKLALVNTPPVTQLELSLLIKDIEDRLSESQINSLLDIVKKHTLIPKDEGSGQTGRKK